MAYIGKQPTPVPLSASDLNDDVISLAKMASGTDGNIISYDASGDPVAIATGNDGQILTSAGAGQPCAFETAASGGKIGQVLQVTDSTTRTTTSGSLNDMSSTLIGVITPVATTSKILVMVTSTLQSPTYGWGGWLYRDIAGGGYEEVGGNYALEVAGVAKQATGTVMCYLDSPSTTSECSYQPYFSITGSGTLTLQYGGNQTYGTITTMEILA